ncbi:hypothetical protein [Spirillospora sp. NPDC047279]|uniref:hypothetical protein n=1 Tax=Spirillospora sp. NPDC047279 TaxID=3155478 RepID=UPI0033DF7611
MIDEPASTPPGRRRLAVMVSGQASPDDRTIPPRLVLAIMLNEVGPVDLLQAGMLLTTGSLGPAKTEATLVVTRSRSIGNRLLEAAALPLLATADLRMGDVDGAALELRPGLPLTRAKTMLAMARATEAKDGPVQALTEHVDVWDRLEEHEGLLVGDVTAAPWLARVALAADDAQRAGHAVAVAPVPPPEFMNALPALTKVEEQLAGVLGPARYRITETGRQDAYIQAAWALTQALSSLLEAATVDAATDRDLALNETDDAAVQAAGHAPDLRAAIQPVRELAAAEAHDRDRTVDLYALVTALSASLALPDDDLTTAIVTAEITVRGSRRGRTRRNHVLTATMQGPGGRLPASDCLTGSARAKILRRPRTAATPDFHACKASPQGHFATGSEWRSCLGRDGATGPLRRRARSGGRGEPDGESSQHGGSVLLTHRGGRLALGGQTAGGVLGLGGQHP